MNKRAPGRITRTDLHPIHVTADQRITHPRHERVARYLRRCLARPECGRPLQERRFRSGRRERVIPSTSEARRARRQPSACGSRQQAGAPHQAQEALTSEHAARRGNLRRSDERLRGIDEQPLVGHPPCGRRTFPGPLILKIGWSLWGANRHRSGLQVLPSPLQLNSRFVRR